MLSSPPCVSQDSPTLESANYELKEKNDTFTVSMELKKDLIVFNLYKKDSISPTPFSNEFDLNNLQKKARIFKVFDNIKEAFDEINQRFKENSCTINYSPEKMILSVKTNVINLFYTGVFSYYFHKAFVHT